MRQQDQQPQDMYQKTLDLAARMLSYRAMTASMLRERLLDKGCMDEAVDYAVEYLRVHRFLDDQKYAESMVCSYMRRGYGTMRIQQELKRRGLTRQQADAAMEMYEPNWEQIYALLDKRLGGDLSDRKAVSKAVAALQRRGFLWDEIRKALDEYSMDQA